MDVGVFRDGGRFTEEFREGLYFGGRGGRFDLRFNWDCAFWIIVLLLLDCYLFNFKQLNVTKMC